VGGSGLDVQPNQVGGDPVGRYGKEMRFAGRESWIVSSGTDHAADLALFVRDALALPLDEPALPGLDPPVPVLSVDGVDRAAVAAEWLGWWADILEFCRYPLTSPPGTHPDLESYPAVETSPALAGRSALRAAIAALTEPVRRYQAGFGFEIPSSMLEGEVVRDLERELGRRARPFRFVFTEVRVQGEVWQPLTDQHVLVSTRFMASPAARPAVREAFARLV
jgi:hypothetical protein